VWEQKIKKTKYALKDWIKIPNNTPSSHKRDIFQQLADQQMEMESKDITNQDLEKEQAAQFNSYHAFRQEEEYWRLKSHSLWLRSGDRHTTFFHRQYRAQISINHISEITLEDGLICKGSTQLKEAAKIYFQKLYKEDGVDSEEVTT